jgi:hypothetical protein
MRYLTLLLSILNLTNSLKAQSSPPAVPANNLFVQMGCLDFRLSGADHTGTQISSHEIQNAVRAAQKNKPACYSTSGSGESNLIIHYPMIRILHKLIISYGIVFIKNTIALT